MIEMMIAVDGSASSLEAVRRGLELVGQGLQAQITLVNVQEEASLLQLATRDPDAIANAAVEAGVHLMAPAVAMLSAAGVVCSQEVALGEPATVLVDMAEQLGADLLVIGAQGMSGLERALMGSVSQAVLRRYSQPVLVVKLEVDAAQEVLDEDGDLEAERR